MRVQLYVTSNNQLVCLAHEVLHRSGIAVPKGWVFDNGTVIRMRGAADGGAAHIQMIHPKAVSNPDRFVSPEAFNEVMAAARVVLPAGSTVYLARHGHAGHNEPAASLQDAHDALLTAAGTEQARLAGAAVDGDLHGQDVVAFAAFCSDLIRTMYTCSIILRQLHSCPSHILPKKCTVCIEARENIRPIGGVHHWQADNPLRRVAIDPFAALEQLRLLAPDKTDDAIERLRVENLPKNNPLDADKCITSVEDVAIDWSDYVAKVQAASAAHKTFGDAASETLFLDVVLRNAQ